MNPKGPSCPMMLQLDGGQTVCLENTDEPDTWEYRSIMLGASVDLHNLSLQNMLDLVNEHFVAVRRFECAKGLVMR